MKKVKVETVIPQSKKESLHPHATSGHAEDDLIPLKKTPKSFDPYMDNPPSQKPNTDNIVLLQRQKMLNNLQQLLLHERPNSNERIEAKRLASEIEVGVYHESKGDINTYAKLMNAVIDTSDFDDLQEQVRQNAREANGVCVKYQKREKIEASTPKSSKMMEKRKSPTESTASTKSQKNETGIKTQNAVTYKFETKDIPVIEYDKSSPIGHGIRQNMIAKLFQEYIRIFPFSLSLAQAKSLEAEAGLKQQSKSVAVYRSSAVSIIQELRKRPTETKKTQTMQPVKKSHSPSGHESDSKNHKVELKSEIELEKPIAALGESLIISPEALIKWDYPLNTTQPSGVQMNTVKTCCRCGKSFTYKFNNAILEKDSCSFHPGKFLSSRSTGHAGFHRSFECCGAEPASQGCKTAPFHVFSHSNYQHMVDAQIKFSQTQSYKQFFDRIPYSTIALDVEMVYTTLGLETSRVTLLDEKGESILDEVCKPEGVIVDYNTTYSGMTASILSKATSTFKELQQRLLNEFIFRETILIGQSLESDLKALRMIHEKVIDTSLIFPHPKEGYKYSLKVLASGILQRIIQNPSALSLSHGHDSREDALTSLDLIKFKLKFPHLVPVKFRPSVQNVED